jgi:hypothetical protein
MYLAQDRVQLNGFGISAVKFLCSASAVLIMLKPKGESYSVHFDFKILNSSLLRGQSKQHSFCSYFLFILTI